MKRKAQTLVVKLRKLALVVSFLVPVQQVFGGVDLGRLANIALNITGQSLSYGWSGKAFCLIIKLYVSIDVPVT